MDGANGSERAVGRGKARRKLPDRNGWRMSKVIIRLEADKVSRQQVSFRVPMALLMGNS